MNRPARLRAVERLSERARHHPHCVSLDTMNPDEDCDCGLADLVRAVKYALLGHVVSGIRDAHSGRYFCVCGESTVRGAPSAELDAFAARHERLGTPSEHDVDNAIRRALTSTPYGTSR